MFRPYVSQLGTAMLLLLLMAGMGGQFQPWWGVLAVPAVREAPAVESPRPAEHINRALQMLDVGDASLDVSTYGKGAGAAARPQPAYVNMRMQWILDGEQLGVSAVAPDSRDSPVRMRPW
jgi:hypothetical protein